jgi:hypothetical protein
LKKSFFIWWSAIGLFFVSCYIYDDSPTAPKNILSVKDSLAVRAILDANGLDTVDVRDAIILIDSYVSRINLNARSLTKFIFCKYLDSISTPPTLDLKYNNIDTIIFDDTINYNFLIRLDSNKLHTIPDGINKMKGSITLYLNSNKINTISPNIMQCDVSYVNVDSNYLCNVSDTMKQWLNTKSGSTAWQSRQTCN